MKEALRCKIVSLNEVYDYFSLLKYLEENQLFSSCSLLESYKNKIVLIISHIQLS